MSARSHARFSITAHALVGLAPTATLACGPMPGSLGASSQSCAPPTVNEGGVCVAQNAGSGAPAPGTGPAAWHFRLGGTGFRQVVEDRVTGRVYGLRIAGGIDTANAGGWVNWDPGGGTRAISADAGTCYVLKDNGNVWRRPEAGGPWEKI